MSKYSVQIVETGRCKITHEFSKSEILTDTPPEYGGKGRSFSSTDLVSAAVGSCVLTTIDSILEREGHDPKLIKITIEKVLSENPKMIKTISLKIFHPNKLSEVTLKKLYRAMDTCPVKRSLNEQVEIKTAFVTF